MTPRAFIAALLAFWLAFGPLASAWAQAADKPCESMGMATPADDCCGNGMSQANCISACLAVSAAMSGPAWKPEPSAGAFLLLGAASVGHDSVLEPPDAAPPKISVS